MRRRCAAGWLWFPFEGLEQGLPTQGQHPWLFVYKLCAEPPGHRQLN